MVFRVVTSVVINATKVTSKRLSTGVAGLAWSVSAAGQDSAANADGAEELHAHHAVTLSSCEK